jgi:aldehyde:ferredoxin oxidoreductase
LGVKEAAKRLGPEAQELAVEVKGLDLPMHEARGKQGLGLSYATAPRGGNHMEGFHDHAFMAPDTAPEIGITKPLSRLDLNDKPDAVFRAENYNSFINSLPICSFMSLAVMGIHNCDELTGLIVAATGWKDFTFEEELTIGERAYSLAKAYTARETGGAPEEGLPKKLADPLPRGGSQDTPVDPDAFKNARSEYYKLRGWNEAGCPTEDRLKELGLEDVAEVLYGKGGKK